MLFFLQKGLSGLVDVACADGQDQVTYELLSSLACAVTLADTALDFFLPARAALAVPFHAVWNMSNWRSQNSSCSYG